VSSTASTATRVLANVRLLVDGSQVGTTDASLTAGGVASTDWGTFGNSFIIKAGKTAEVKVIGDTTDTATAADDTFIVGVSAGTSNAQGTVSLTSISTVAQNANTLTVKGGQVTISKNAAFGDKLSTNPTGPVNASGAKVASFTITAGSGESVDVSQISLTDTVVGTAYLGTYMQNITRIAGDCCRLSSPADWHDISSVVKGMVDPTDIGQRATDHPADQLMCRSQLSRQGAARREEDRHRSLPLSHRHALVRHPLADLGAPLLHLQKRHRCHGARGHEGPHHRGRRRQ
jgi:hypothetical protein